MRIAKYKTTVLFFVLFSFTSNGQNNIIDSLKRVLQTQKEDTARVNTLNQFGVALRNNGHYNETKEGEGSSFIIQLPFN